MLRHSVFVPSPASLFRLRRSMFVNFGIKRIRQTFDQHRSLRVIASFSPRHKKVLFLRYRSFNASYRSSFEKRVFFFFLRRDKDERCWKRSDFRFFIKIGRNEVGRTTGRKRNSDKAADLTGDRADGATGATLKRVCLSTTITAGELV